MTASVPAPWRARAVALAIDVLPGCAVATAMALAAVTMPLGSLWWWLCIAVGAASILLTAANRVLLPTVGGWTLGRAAVGAAIVRGGASAEPVGVWRLLLRDLGHVLDTLSVFAGWLWPLFDPRRRTFADMLTDTEIRRMPLRTTPPNLRALVSVVFLAAALLCIMGAATSYVAVYRPDRAIEQARVQIAEQGPKIVEQLLSYQPDSLDDDFERAQSLATDNYREQLVPRQQVVREGTPVANQYWVTNRSVLSATADDATMLMFMQGQRGGEGNERLITATVRVTFIRSGEQWRVDDLVVVTKPLPAEGRN